MNSGEIFEACFLTFWVGVAVAVFMHVWRKIGEHEDEL